MEVDFELTPEDLVALQRYYLTYRRASSRRPRFLSPIFIYMVLIFILALVALFSPGGAKGRKDFDGKKLLFELLAAAVLGLALFLYSLYRTPVARARAMLRQGDAA